MTEAYQPRHDALKHLLAHPFTTLKPLFDVCDFPINPEIEVLKYKEFINALLHAGAKLVEVLNDDPASDTVIDEIFITVPDPLPKTLLVEMVDLRPDEFDEIEPNVFRLWWD